MELDVRIKKSEWAISSDGEHYSAMGFPTRDEAIAEGREFYKGEEFYVGFSERPVQPEDLFSAEEWLNIEHEDYLGEYADGWDLSTKLQREELEKNVREVMAAWLDKYGLRPNFFVVTNPEKIPAKDAD